MNYMPNQYYQAGTAIRDGNLTFYDLANGANNNYCFGTMAFSTGKFYWEVTPTASVQYLTTGISFRTDNTWYLGSPGGQGIGYGNGSIYSYDGTGTTRQSSLTVLGNNQVLGIAVDADNKTIQFYIQGNAIGTAQSYSAYDSLGQGLVVPHAISANQIGTTASFNFGQRAFAYTPPTGFKSLNTTNLQALGASAVGNAAITPNKWMDVNLYGGTGATQTVTNSGFQPDFMLSKARGGARSWRVIDSVRGSRIEYYADATSGEAVDGSTVRFESNGFTIDNSTNSQYNTLGDNYVSWQWKQSPSSGFNIISYTGNGASSRTITHNLGVAPKFIITKRRESSNWWVYHQGQQAAYPGQWLYFNLYFSTQNTANAVDAPYFKTDPTSSVFSIAGDGINTNGGTYMSYVWAEVPGFSKMGSYVGNGSTNGSFVYTGFRPRFVLLKALGSATDWYIYDTARDARNPTTLELNPNLTAVEQNNTYGSMDILSNGFKLRFATGEVNASGVYYIYTAFAESPFGLNNRAR